MFEFNMKEKISDRFYSFYNEILTIYNEKIHSIYIIGSVLTDDFDHRQSDINSVFVLKKMDLKFLEILAPLGKKYGKKRISAPLIMTPEYIRNSLDIFPIEFLNIKMIHKIVFGEDIFQAIEINRADLRYQCEKELKVKLIGLRQRYISSSGDRKVLIEGFVNSFSGYIPLFRGIIYLLGKKPPINSYDVLTILKEVSGVNIIPFEMVFKIKKNRIKLSIEQLNTIFKNYYETIEKLGEIVDEIKE